MIISYDILWIDDRIEDAAMQGAVGNVMEHLKKQGFNPKIQQCLDAEEAKEHLEVASSYDLILSDYNLSESDDKAQIANNGDMLIKGIRERKIFTEILFYSAQGNLSKIAAKLAREEIDRVSFLSLTANAGTGESYSDLVQKTTHLIDLTVKKLQEVKNLRGLVIGAASELDTLVHHKLEKILMGSDVKDEIKNSILCRISKKAQDNLSMAKKINKENLCEMLNSPKTRFLFDAYMKSRILDKYLRLKKPDNAYKNGYSSFSERYQKEVSNIRNDLAHGVTKESFGAKRCVDCRIKINKLYELIDSLEIT